MDGYGCAFEKMPEFHDNHIRWITDITTVTGCWAGHTTSNSQSDLVLTQSIHKRAMMALGRSPEYHWNQIISKSVHRFSRGSRLKLFSIYSPGGHFVQQCERFEQFL